MLLLNSTLSYCQNCSLGARKERKAICTVLSPEFHKVGKSPWSMVVPFSPESHFHILEKIAVSGRKAIKSEPIHFSSVYLAQTTQFFTITTLSHRRSWGHRIRIRESQWDFSELQSNIHHNPLKIPWRKVWGEGEICLVRDLRNLSAETMF